MKFSTDYAVRVLATGFVVMTLLSIPLFWMRFFCRANLSAMMPDNVRNFSIEPSGYISPDIEEDPNVIQRSQVSANIDEDYFMCLGVLDYLMSRYLMGYRCDVYVARSEDDSAHFDRASGQIICRYTQTETMPDKSSLGRQVQYHVGPDGISEIPDDALGRFVEPIINSWWQNWGSTQPNPPDLIMYDKKLGQFFKVDFDRATVTKGPQVSATDRHQPIQIGWPDKNSFLLHLIWKAPGVDAPGDRDSGSSYRRQRGEVRQSAQYYPAAPHVLVLDKSGRVDLLDKDTLEFTGTAGRLPEPITLFGSRHSAKPHSLLSYDVRPLYLGERFRPLDSDDKGKPAPDPNSLRYAGMFAASLSRDGTAAAITTFDDKGEVSKSGYSRPAKYRGRSHSTSEDVYFGTTWAPLTSAGKYLTESLHPPILSAASCFTVSAIEAGAGHRALFLLPNSFFVMNSRDDRQIFSSRIMSTLLLMLPAVILAAWLSAQVRRDAAAIGLSENLTRFWVLLTLAFGLAGYITYALTRPGTTLVTCPNCGKGRRPDADTCHHCAGEWDIPELTPPAWRVLDGAD